MADEKKSGKDIVRESVVELLTLDGIQKYVLGTKKNGTPRAVYDVIKDCTQPKKKKKKKKKHGSGTVNVYASYGNGPKKKKKKGHWHI